ncbi:hypothetical protein [Paraclostridium bifermentans]|uniref:hypothetical protein n=1 Tax=Paraclostridium bifermentans TaxID=1490 RepID=UPI0011DC8BBC|nr:hypothetical protein [Paraclostridium bifermentans]MDU3801928.1 hypothetical protein [Paraclostridium bifermentans]
MNKEGKVVVVSTILTTALVSGFTLSQAPILANEEYKRVEKQEVALKNIEDKTNKQENKKDEITKEDETTVKYNGNEKKHKKDYYVNKNSNQQTSINSQYKTTNEQQNQAKPSVKPEKPTVPPVKPDEPVTPENPVKPPVKPDEPVTPENPGEPPVKPEEPTLPEKPEDPIVKPEEESDKSNTSSNLGEEVSQNVYYNDINKK